jgi:hypothetical protein
MRNFIFLICCIFLVACSPTRVLQPFPETTPTANSDSTVFSGVSDPMNDLPTETSNPYSPQAGDEKFSRAKVFLDSSQINIMESYPVQINLYLQGSLPTPCHQLRIIFAQPDTEKRIQIEVYSVVDPEKICAQMLKIFEANIPLGSFPIGNYSIWINGTQIGEFDS